MRVQKSEELRDAQARQEDLLMPEQQIEPPETHSEDLPLEQTNERSENVEDEFKWTFSHRPNDLKHIGKQDQVWPLKF